MNISYKILLLVLLIFFAGHKSFARNVSQPGDTLKAKTDKIETKSNKEDRDSKKVDNNRSFRDNNNSKSQFVKQVKSARPDMSKARGARPPVIERPSGSRIPNGIGRPTGAARPGHG